MDATAFNVVLACIGAALLLFAFVARPLKHAATLPVVAFALGIALGPAVLDLVRLPSGQRGDGILEQLARVSLAVALIGVALRFDRERLRTWLRPGLILLFGAMLAMWAASAFLVWVLFPVAPAMAALIGAVVTPTDPVVASSIVSGPAAEKYIPERLRMLLSFESGANDGLGYLLVMLPVLLLSQPGGALLEWLGRVLLWEVCGAAVIAIAAGVLTGRLLERAQAARTSTPTFLLVGVFGLALALVGGLKLLHTDGILAVFAGGVAFSLQLDRDTREELRDIAEAASKLVLTPMFLLFATELPWSAWTGFGASAALFALAILLLRRPLPLWPLLGRLRGARAPRDRAFLGWFGPMGVSSMFYVLLATRHLHDPQVMAIGSIAIAASVVAHGLSSGVLTRRYGRAEARADG